MLLFSQIATNSNPGIVQFRQDLDALNQFIEMFNFPQQMARRMREYMHQQQGEQMRKFVTQNALERLSPALQIEAVLHVHRREATPYL